MSNADPLADLALRERQLVSHLLSSPEYLHQVRWRQKKWTVISVAALLSFFFGGYIYLHEPPTDRAVVMASMDALALLLVIGIVLLVRASCCLGRLNERWLSPEAKKTLQALRLEKAKGRDGIS